MNITMSLLKAEEEVDEHAVEMQEKRNLLDSLLTTMFGKHELKQLYRHFLSHTVELKSAKNFRICGLDWGP